MTCPVFPLKGSAPLIESGRYEPLLNDGEVLLNYLCLRHHLPSQTDVMVLLGSDFEETAYSASVLLEFLSVKTILCSGGKGRLTPRSWEAEGPRFAEILTAQGLGHIPILVENESSNTGENIKLSKELLGDRPAESIVLLQYPVLQRRAWLTARRIFLRGEIFSWAPFLPNLSLALPGWELGEWRRRLLWDAAGEVFRIIAYQKPERDYLAAEDVPATVIETAQRVGNAMLRDVSIPDDHRAQLEKLMHC